MAVYLFILDAFSPPCTMERETQPLNQYIHSLYAAGCKCAANVLEPHQAERGVRVCLIFSALLSEVCHTEDRPCLVQYPTASVTITSCYVKVA